MEPAIAVGILCVLAALIAAQRVLAYLSTDTRSLGFPLQRLFGDPVVSSSQAPPLHLRERILAYFQRVDAPVFGRTEQHLTFRGSYY